MSVSPTRWAMKSEIIGHGDPLILVPGGLTGWLSWKPHAERLASRYQVVRVQLLAVELGLRKAPLPEEYSVDLESAALLHALDQSRIAKADFAAWSYGAEITLDFALDYPDRVRTLTLIEPPAFWVTRSRGPLSSEAVEFQRQLKLLGPGDVSESQLEAFTYGAGFVPLTQNPRTLPQWPMWVEHRQSLRPGDLAFRHDDDIRRVRGFHQPVLLFKGEGSRSYLHQIIDILGEEFPRARVETLPGLHALHIYSMERFLGILTSFLDQVHREASGPAPRS